MARERPGHILHATSLDDALRSLEALDQRKARVIEMRFFGGLSLEETADVLQVSVATVRRDWSMARAWLHRELSRQPRTDRPARGTPPLTSPMLQGGSLQGRNRAVDPRKPNI